MPLYDNEVRAELTASADPSTETQITVKAPDSKPNNLPPDPGGSPAPLTLIDGWYGYTESERITYTNRQDNGNGTYTLTGVSWAQEGTTSPAGGWPVGTFVVQDIPASWYEDREGAGGGAHTHTAAEIDSETAAAGDALKADGSSGAAWGPVGWNEIANKPVEFTPAAHDHTANDIDSTGSPSGYVLTADGNGGASWQEQTGGGGGGGGGIAGINNQTGTSYTLVAGDLSKLIRMSNDGDNIVYVPPNASVPRNVADEILIRQVGQGMTTVRGQSGVTVNDVRDFRPSRKGDFGRLINTGTDAWDLVGAIKRDWKPTDLGSLVAWFSFYPDQCWEDTAGSVAASEGSALARVDDRSGNGYNATQSTSGNRPILRRDAAGWFYADFDGLDDYLTAAFSGPITQPTTVALAALLSDDSGVTTRTILNGDDGTHRNAILFNADTDEWSMYAGNPDALLGPASALNVAIIMCEFNGANSKAWVNGFETTPAVDPGSEVLDGVNIGANVSGGSNWQGRIYGVVIVDSALTEVERLELTRYLASQCEYPLTIPSSLNAL